LREVKFIISSVAPRSTQSIVKSAFECIDDCGQKMMVARPAPL
jgi:hypothetical protein